MPRVTRPLRPAAPRLPPAARPAAPKPVPPAASPFVSGTTTTGTTTVPHVRGPEDAALPGDLVMAPAVQLTATQVLTRWTALQARLAKTPGLREQLLKAPYPKQAGAQTDWALVHTFNADHLKDPLWTVGTNDNRAALTQFVQGVLQASQAGLPVAGLEAQVLAAQESLSVKYSTDPGIYNTLTNGPVPTSLPERLEWAVAVNASAWDADSLPALKDPAVAALVHFTAGALIKTNSAALKTTIVSERRTLSVDGDTRVYGIHTPPGKAPAGGWPTVVFFHGSFGGYAPEQHPEYQQMLATADAHGYQVVFPVGSPQDRADLTVTGRGMLNWDPVGAGPGGANDRFVFSLLKKLKTDGVLDSSRTFVAGHSQGGFYTSDLIASYGDAFAGAEIMGAGAGSIAGNAGFAALTRKTPLLIHVGKDDLHLPLAKSLVNSLKAAKYPVRFDSPDHRGHDVEVPDYEDMFSFFDRQPPLQNSSIGRIDGTHDSGRTVTPATQVFRDFIDVAHPPAGLTADALRALKALATDRRFQLDGKPTRLSLQEFRGAFAQYATFPPAMQAALWALRSAYVLAPKPAGASLDLQQIPASMSADPDVAAALAVLSYNSALDVDGYVEFVTQPEFDLLKQAAAGNPTLARGFDKLLAEFTRQQHPQPLPKPVTTTSVTGARIQSYPGTGSEKAIANMEGVLKAFQALPAGAALVKKLTVVIGPPGVGLDKVFNDPELVGNEGFSIVTSQYGFKPPMLAVTGTSISSWTLGATHELIHSLEVELGAPTSADVNATFAAVHFLDGPNGYPNAHEMLAYFGQWYAAGFGAELKAAAPQVYELCARVLGPLRVDPGAITSADAKSSLKNLLTWFKKGST